MQSRERVLVQFQDIEECYFIDNRSMQITYVLQKEYQPSSKDWIGIFPRGWHEFDQMILADYVHPRTVGTKTPKVSFELFFNFSENKVICFNADYQVVYVGEELKVMGRSSYFRLYRSNEVTDQCVEYEGTGSAQVKRTAIPKSNEPSVVSAPPVEVTHFKKKWEDIAREQQSSKPAFKNNKMINSERAVKSSPSNEVTHSKGQDIIDGWGDGCKKQSPAPAFNNNKMVGTPTIFYPPRSRSKQMINHQSPVAEYQKDYGATRCDFCQRNNQLVQEKQKLSSQVKDLAECNYDLRNKVKDLEHQLEMSMVAQRTMKLHICRLNQEIQSYEKVIKCLLDNLQGYIPVCIDSEGSEILVQRVHPEVESQLMRYTARSSNQNERYLKAIIGNQEKTIQELTARLSKCQLQSKGFVNGVESGKSNEVVRVEETAIEVDPFIENKLPYIEEEKSS